MSRTNRKEKREPNQGAGTMHRPGAFMGDKRTKRKKTRGAQKREAYRGQEN